MIKKIPNQYEIIADEENKAVVIYLLNPAYRKEFKTPMLFSNNGVWFSKVSGGKAVHINKLVKTLGIDEDTINKIKSFLKVKGLNL